MKAEYICADQSVTSFFACDKAADHTFWIADQPPTILNPTCCLRAVISRSAATKDLRLLFT